MVPFWDRVDRSGGPDACWPWTGTVTTNGYGRINRQVNGRLVPLSVHPIACEAAHGPRPAGHEAAHSCHNPPCCNPRHLRWATHQENAEDMTRAGRQARGERQGSAKLTEAETVAIRKEYAAGGTTQGALARRYGVGQVTISEVILGKTWRHLPLAA